MFSVIFTMVIMSHISEEATAAVYRSGADWLGSCDGLSPVDGAIPFMAIVPDEATLLAIEQVLSTLGTTSIIGVWNNKGLQQGYHCEMIEDGDNSSMVAIIDDDYVAEDGTVTPAVRFPFDLDLYMSHLNDVNVVDDEGVVVSSSRPTAPTQVQNWAGWGDRDLTDHGES